MARFPLRFPSPSRKEPRRTSRVNVNTPSLASASVGTNSSRASRAGSSSPHTIGSDTTSSRSTTTQQQQQEQQEVDHMTHRLDQKLGKLQQLLWHVQQEERQRVQNQNQPYQHQREAPPSPRSRQRDYLYNYEYGYYDNTSLSSSTKGSRDPPGFVPTNNDINSDNHMKRMPHRVPTAAEAATTRHATSVRPTMTNSNVLNKAASFQRQQQQQQQQQRFGVASLPLPTLTAATVNENKGSKGNIWEDGREEQSRSPSLKWVQNNNENDEGAKNVICVEDVHANPLTTGRLDKSMRVAPVAPATPTTPTHTRTMAMATSPRQSNLTISSSPSRNFRLETSATNTTQSAQTAQVVRDMRNRRIRAGRSPSPMTRRHQRQPQEQEHYRCSNEANSPLRQHVQRDRRETFGSAHNDTEPLSWPSPSPPRTRREIHANTFDTSEKTQKQACQEMTRSPDRHANGRKAALPSLPTFATSIPLEQTNTSFETLHLLDIASATDARKGFFEEPIATRIINHGNPPPIKEENIAGAVPVVQTISNVTTTSTRSLDKVLQEQDDDEQEKQRNITSIRKALESRKIPARPTTVPEREDTSISSTDTRVASSKSGSGDTFEKSMANSLMGDWDPEKEISLFYTKYQKMGKFDAGKKKTGDQKQRQSQPTPNGGFFESLGRAIDDVQRMVCADADDARRDEPPVEMGVLSSCQIGRDKDCSL